MSQICGSSFTYLLILLNKLQKRSKLMNFDNNSVVTIGSALNCLFLISLIVFDKYWDNVSGWVFYSYMFLMITNGVILSIYAAKSKK